MSEDNSQPQGGKWTALSYTDKVLTVIAILLAVNALAIFIVGFDIAHQIYLSY